MKNPRSTLSRILLLFLISDIFSLISQAQSVGVGTTNPHPTARLDIWDTTRGLLIPRLTTQQRNAIQNPAHTLIIFNIDSFRLEVYDTATSKWHVVSRPIRCIAKTYSPTFAPSLSDKNVAIGTSRPHPSAILEIWDTIRGILLPRLTIAQRNAISNPAHGLIIFNSDSFSLEIYDTVTASWYTIARPLNCKDSFSISSSVIFSNPRNIGIGTSTPHPSAILEIWDNHRGLLIPRLTTQQRNRISNPAHGLIIFNVDFFSLEIYDTITNAWYVISQPKICESILNCTPMISGPNFVCAGDTVRYIAEGCPEANYQWTIPIAWTNIPAQSSDTLIIIPDTTDGFIQVQPYTKCECCYGHNFTLPVIADTAPDCLPVITGPTSVCADDTIYFVAHGCSDASYQWIVPNGWTLLSGQGADTLYLIPDTTAGNVSVQACNQCGCTYAVSSLTVSANTEPSCVPALAGPTFVCAGDTVLYVASGCSANFLQWTVPPGWIIVSGQGLDTLQVIPDTTSGMISVQACNQCGCGSSTSMMITADSCKAFCLAVGGSNTDMGFSITRTIDGGYIIAGYTQSFGQGGEDVYIVKLDGAGNMQWTKTIGGIGHERGYSIVQTTDSGYAIAGWTNSFGQGSRDIYVIKLDASGNLQWTRTVGGANDDVGFAIIQTTDNGYAIAGFTSSFGQGGPDVYIVKLDSVGNLQWTRTIGGANGEFGSSIVQTADGGYIITGGTSTFCSIGCPTGYDLYVVKLDATGNLQWTKAIGGSNYETSRSIIQTPDGGYVIVGWTNSFGQAGWNVYVVKLTNTGQLLWTRTIGGPRDEFGSAVIQTTDGGLAIAGATWSFGQGGWDVYLVKLDNAGNLLWTRTIGGPMSDYGYSIIQTPDGGFAIVGRTQSFGQGSWDIYVVKVDANGNLISCPNGCQVSSGGGVNSGGMMNSGGSIGSGGIASSGGLVSSGGILTNVCP